MVAYMSKAENPAIRWIKTLVVAGAVVMPLTGAGRAADMPGVPLPQVVAPDYGPRDVFLAGWYLRADIGSRWGVLTNTSVPAGFVAPTDNSFGNGTVYGLGAGFRDGWIRGDFTVDFGSKQDYRGTVVSPGDVTAKVQASTGLLNVYADLGTWSRLTPYIGAGIGAARITVSDLATVDPAFANGSSRGQWGLAWAAMAGTAVSLTRNLQIDLGYRYLGIGNAETPSGPAGSVTLRNLGAHEFRAGLRLSLDGLSRTH